jgi:hypothetical protein
MNPFFNQAKHNQDFLECIKEKFPNDFYDWKITIIFYISIHLLKCLAHKKGVDIGHTHYDIENSLNPRRSARQVFQFPDWAWKNYSRIFKYSKDSRYDGIPDQNIVLYAQKKNYEECEKLFKSFCSYMKSNGIEI